MKYLLLLLIAALPLSIQAQEVPAYKMRSFSNCQQGNCITQYGTGILLKIVDGHGWFITAGHVVAERPAVEIGNHFYNLSKIQSWKSTGVAPDTIALLRTEEPMPSSGGRGYSTHYMTNRKPKAGDEVWLIGFPGMKYKYISTTITEVQGVQFLTRHHLKSGASGGLVVFQDDQSLAGVIHAYTGDTLEGVHTRADYIYYKMKDQFANLLQSSQDDDLAVNDTPGYGIPNDNNKREGVQEARPPVKQRPRGVTEEELDDKLRELQIEQNQMWGKVLRSIVDENNAQHKKHIEEMKRNKEESSNQHAELRDMLADIYDQFMSATDEQDKKLDVIKKQNKTFQEKFREQIENPPGSKRRGGKTEAAPVDPEDPNVQEARPYQPPLQEEHSRVPLPPFRSPDQQPSVSGPDSGDLFSGIGGAMMGIPWLALLGGLGISIPGGAAGYLAIKGVNSFLRRRRDNKKGGQPVDDEPASLFRRDVSEAQQILNLRQSEQREPIFDAMRGVLLEDEVGSNPDQSLKEAYESINRRFNSIAPISTRHETINRGK